MQYPNALRYSILILLSSTSLVHSKFWKVGFYETDSCQGTSPASYGDEVGWSCYNIDYQLGLFSVQSNGGVGTNWTITLWSHRDCIVVPLSDEWTIPFDSCASVTRSQPFMSFTVTAI